MLEEAAVFNSEDSLNQVRWDFIVSDQAALGAVLVVAESGDELWFEFVGAQSLALVVADGGDYAGFKMNRCAIGCVEGLRPGMDCDGVDAFGVGAEL